MSLSITTDRSVSTDARTAAAIDDSVRSARSGAPLNQPLNPLIKLCGIGKSFPGVRALQNVSLSLWPGEVHLIMGENGAGKSTLM